MDQRAIPGVAHFAARFALGVALACAGGTAWAAAISGVAATPGFRPQPSEDPFAVERIEGPAPILLPSRREDTDIDEVLDSLRVQRPRLEDDAAWFVAPAPQPAALQVDTLLDGVGWEVWLDERTTSTAESDAGLHDLVRGLVNVWGDENGQTLESSAHLATEAGTGGKGVGGSAGPGRGEYLRHLISSVVEPYRRADGSVGFSILGFGDFYAEVERGRRSVHLVEENTGLSLVFRRPPSAAPAQPRVVADADENGRVEAGDPRDENRVVRPIQPDHRLTALLRDVMRWVTESLLLRILVLLWVLMVLGHAIVTIARAFHSRRRASRHALEPHPAPATGGLPTPPAARRRDGSRQRRPRRHRRLSPTLRNLLRSLGLR